MIRFLTILTAILFFAFVASAQQITVSGFVYESQSGEPLISASTEAEISPLQTRNGTAVPSRSL